MSSARFVYASRDRFPRHLSVSGLFVGLFLLAMSIQPVALHAGTYSDLHDFNCPTDGCAPNYSGILAQGRDGSIYGTLPIGGSGGYGTVFKITPSGSLTVLYSFTGVADGGYPYGGLTLGTDGNLYGTTEPELNGCYGTVFKISPNGGTPTTLHCFTALNGDGYYPYSPPVQGKNGLYGVTEGYQAYMISPSGAYKSFPTQLPGSAYGPLVLASDGNFYGTTESGGTLGYGTVFRLSSSGTVKVIYNFDSTHGANPYAGLVQGGDGNLYGTTYLGGANNEGTIFKLTLRGSITMLYSFNSQSSDGAYPFAGLVAGTDGNFYGTASISTGAAYGVIFEITPGGTYSVLYTFDDTHGRGPNSTAIGDTKGVIYGQTSQGGTNNTGVFWSLNKGILPFCSVVGFPAGTSGTTVEVLGQGFSNGITSIKFGSGTATSFTVVNDTYLTVKVPATGTTGPITVSENGGATLTSKQTFDVLPVLTSFQPTSGPVGTNVTLTGSGFIGATSVRFNGVAATFTVNSATKITATVPNGATSGKIKVTTPVGSATSSGSFTVT